MDDEVLVSVAMITYNHGKYIRQALDSVLMQKVSFKYEIIIGDDYSPDDTQDILREYQEKYFNIVKPIFRQKNVGATTNYYEVNKMCRGKYIAVLEGDDYWIDENKLQIQVDFLESNFQSVSVAHRHEIVDVNGMHIAYSHEGIKLNRYFDKKHVMKYKAGLLHLNTLMYRNFFYNSNDKYVIVKDSNKFGIHSLMIFLLATMSDIYIMENTMSAWRMVVDQNATNYTSVISTRPLEDSINQFIKYKNYREYFKDEYDFNYIIQRSFIVCLVQIIKSNLGVLEKVKKIVELHKYLKFNDSINIPIIIGQLLIKRILRKNLNEK
ncbi:glycosyltransferase family 2 protein [Clostridium folliculivorans]|uniref:glycosyltransferase family 2 protein n=1 Tax=Clostridium folliculivorans TaxID=2886038 RepID=UPI0021C34EA4|nr:glycosyltransferase family 2 protein [Clostridium folliculivorans]GKU31645.1 hypothetical protein CFB3_37520 [Clostridium folliculivorans]